MSERLKNLGRMQEKIQEAERLELRMVGLRDSIRNVLDPFVDLEQVNLAIALEQVHELADLQGRLKAARLMISGIRKALGEEP